MPHFILVAGANQESGNDHRREE